MAYANSMTNVSTGLPGSRTTGIIAGIKTALHRRKVYKATLQELNALSTRELSDLGIARSMITRLALEAAYAERQDRD